MRTEDEEHFKNGTVWAKAREWDAQGIRIQQGLDRQSASWSPMAMSNLPVAPQKATQGRRGLTAYTVVTMAKWHLAHENDQGATLQLDT